MAKEVGYFEDLTAMPDDGPFVVCRLRGGLRYAVEIAPRSGHGCPTVPSEYVNGVLEQAGMGRGNFPDPKPTHAAADYLNALARDGDLDLDRIRQTR
jgi:hypothetical protein